MQIEVLGGGAESEAYIGRLYGQARMSVLCVGASFYRTIKLHKDIIIRQMQSGVRFEFCFLSRKADFARIAPQFRQSSDQLRTEVETTWAEVDELVRAFPQRFRAIPTAICPPSRIYIADPDSDNPPGLVVFYANVTDSVQLKGFVVSNFKDEVSPWRVHFDDALRKVAEESSNDVFIIHGHGEAKWRELKEVLNAVGANPVVLRDLVGHGAEPWIDRFMKVAPMCEFAIAVLTEDDWIQAKAGKKAGNKESYFQPRPNVLIEIGYFLSRLSLNKIMILVKGEVEMPSDLKGLVIHRFHENVEELHSVLRSELQAAGII